MWMLDFGVHISFRSNTPIFSVHFFALRWILCRIFFQILSGLFLFPDTFPDCVKDMPNKQLFATHFQNNSEGLHLHGTFLPFNSSDIFAYSRYIRTFSLHIFSMSHVRITRSHHKYFQLVFSEKTAEYLMCSHSSFLHFHAVYALTAL